ncbi:MAG: uracil-DNA glycosylase family protein [Erythrobacter sp.]
MNAPNTSSSSPIADELAAAMEWWRAAGVDSDFTDDATAWFLSGEDEAIIEGADGREATAPKQRRKAQKSPGGDAQEPAKIDSPRVDFLGSSPPADLDAFREFWLSAPGLDVIGPRGRVPPRGKAGAELMVLVVDPEDTDTQSLLSGRQGRLLDNILSAMGVADENVYFASALPRHTPMADTAAIAAGGMDAVLRHHIALARPKRLIAFGAGLAAFLAHDVSNAETSLREINHTPATPPAMMSEGLDSLMDMPRLKARFWRRWIEWSARH